MNCDCPACQPLCRRIGHKCFVPCDECMDAVEYDAIGALTSRTVTLSKPGVLYKLAVPSIYSEGFWRGLVEAGWLKEGEA